MPSVPLVLRSFTGFLLLFCENEQLQLTASFRPIALLIDDIWLTVANIH